MTELDNLGFIMLRHVNNEQTNNYWSHCYDCIRKFYPESKILIIDDNSNYNFITEKELYKTKIIQSEYPKRGEILPYYYYLKNKEFDTALILHDSAFINKKLEVDVKDYKILWCFEHRWDQIKDETTMIEKFDDLELKEFYEDKKRWKGCFGGMSIITHDYLTKINNKYDISKLLDCITTRYNRCSFERVIGCLMEYSGERYPSLFGDINKYGKWEIKFHEKEKYEDTLPIIKVWTGR